jgi:hypothetical protein
MIKFGKSGKPYYLVLYFGTSVFLQFQNKNMNGVKSEDLRIPIHLRHGKGIRSIKGLRWKKSKSKAEAEKTKLSDLVYRSIRYFPE